MTVGGGKYEESRLGPLEPKEDEVFFEAAPTGTVQIFDETRGIRTDLLEVKVQAGEIAVVPRD